MGGQDQERPGTHRHRAQNRVDPECQKGCCDGQEEGVATYIALSVFPPQCEEEQRIQEYRIGCQDDGGSGQRGDSRRERVQIQEQ
jgi:hypothetical protein